MAGGGATCAIREIVLEKQQRERRAGEWKRNSSSVYAYVSECVLWERYEEG